jgi:hypothetical protein
MRFSQLICAAQAFSLRFLFSFRVKSKRHAAARPPVRMRGSFPARIRHAASLGRWIYLVALTLELALEAS